MVSGKQRFPEKESLSYDLYLLVLGIIGNNSNPSFMSHRLEDFRAAVMMNLNSVYKYICMYINIYFHIYNISPF
jgi:hypothetical protein